MTTARLSPSPSLTAFLVSSFFRPLTREAPKFGDTLNFTTPVVCTRLANPAGPVDPNQAFDSPTHPNPRNKYSLFSDRLRLGDTLNSTTPVVCTHLANPAGSIGSNESIHSVMHPGLQNKDWPSTNRLWRGDTSIPSIGELCTCPIHSAFKMLNSGFENGPATLFSPTAGELRTSSASTLLGGEGVFPSIFSFALRTSPFDIRETLDYRALSEFIGFQNSIASDLRPFNLRTLEPSNLEIIGLVSPPFYFTALHKLLMANAFHNIADKVKLSARFARPPSTRFYSLPAVQLPWFNSSLRHFVAHTLCVYKHRINTLINSSNQLFPNPLRKNKHENLIFKINTHNPFAPFNPFRVFRLKTREIPHCSA